MILTGPKMKECCIQGEGDRPLPKITFVSIRTAKFRKEKKCMIMGSYQSEVLTVAATSRLGQLLSPHGEFELAFVHQLA